MLLEMHKRNDLKQQTAPHNHAVDVVDPGEGDSERNEKISLLHFNPLYCKCDQVLNVQRLQCSTL